MEEDVVEANRSLLSPIDNPDARIIYLHRNLFDHCVSSSQMINRQPAEQRRFPGEMTPARHLRLLGAQQYLKQHLSFLEVGSRFPDNVLAVTYESLMREPAATFARMLRFLGFVPDSDARRDAINQAVEAVSLSAMRRKEADTGRSVSGQPLAAQGSHISDGLVGKWRGHFSEKDIAFAKETFARFGLSFRDQELD
jgi:hypothetical protein